MQILLFCLDTGATRRFLLRVPQAKRQHRPTQRSNTEKWSTGSTCVFLVSSTESLDTGHLCTYVFVQLQPEKINTKTPRCSPFGPGAKSPFSGSTPKRALKRIGRCSMIGKKGHGHRAQRLGPGGGDGWIDWVSVKNHGPSSARKKCLTCVWQGRKKAPGSHLGVEYEYGLITGKLANVCVVTCNVGVMWR